jgi:pimeloyl-ACP methyl ester carboxylesterase
MSYPGYLYLLNESHDWPGEPVNPDGTLRVPMWNKDQPITPDQYEHVQDKSMMDRYGTLQLACAKEGTDFYDRMAAFPVVFEETGKDLMGRHLPEDEYSIYIHGHSTGGPFSFMLTQRVPNIVGVLGMENSPFGYIYSQLIGGRTWNLPFNCLSEFTWRITAMYAGSEAFDNEGGEALMHLPKLMEQVLESYQRGTTGPRFKAEYPVHLNGVESLIAAARATAERLDLNAEETAELVRRYRSYPRELSGPGVKPVPPVLFSIAQKSMDHTYEGYTQIVLPMFTAMNPAPKVHLVPFEAGVHSYSRVEPDLPMGLAPAMVQLWHDAIMGGYYQ